MMQYILLGGAGGALIEAVAFFGRLGEWRAARLTPAGNRRQNPPTFMDFIDLKPIIAIAITRLVLGGAAATAFGVSGQATGAFGALTVGAAAPALLAQLGQIRQLRDAVNQPAAHHSEPPERRAPAAALTGSRETPGALAAEEGEAV